jgi:hypothetical protein
MSTEENNGIPSYKDAYTALVTFVSKLAQDQSAPAHVRAEAGKVVGDWAMASIMQIAADAREAREPKGGAL